MNVEQMLSIEEREFLVSKINDKLNIPFIGEKTEALIILSAICYFEQILAVNHNLSLKEVVNDFKGVQDTSLLVEKIEDLIERVQMPLLRKKKAMRIFKLSLLILAEASEVGKKIELVNIEG